MICIAQARLEIASNLAELVRIRVFLRGFCQNSIKPVLDEDGFKQLELAVNEATSNIIRHAYDGRTDQSIQVEVVSFLGRVCVWLYHFGKTFVPEAVKPPTFDGSQEKGFGLYLISQCVDEVSYARDDQGRNYIYLVKFQKTSPK